MRFCAESFCFAPLFSQRSKLFSEMNIVIRNGRRLFLFNWTAIAKRHHCSLFLRAQQKFIFYRGSPKQSIWLQSLLVKAISIMSVYSTRLNVCAIFWALQRIYHIRWHRVWFSFVSEVNLFLSLEYIRIF